MKVKDLPPLINLVSKHCTTITLSGAGNSDDLEVKAATQGTQAQAVVEQDDDDGCAGGACKI